MLAFSRADYSLVPLDRQPPSGSSLKLWKKALQASLSKTFIINLAMEERP